MNGLWAVLYVLGSVARSLTSTASLVVDSEIENSNFTIAKVPKIHEFYEF